MKRRIVTVALFIRLSGYAKAHGLRDAFCEIVQAKASAVENRPRLVLDAGRGLALRDVVFTIMPHRRSLWPTAARLLPDEVTDAIARIPLRYLVRIVEGKRSSGLIFAETATDSDKPSVLIILTDTGCGMTLTALATATVPVVDLLADGNLSLDCSTASLLTAVSA